MAVEHAGLAAVAAWESFYVIVGSSATALTSLQFVVIALVADSPTPTSTSGIRAFATPNIVHFCAVLLVSTILSAPWSRYTSLAFALGICGIAGVAYALMTIHRTRRQTSYKPVFEDWLWHCILPFIGYFVTCVAALLIPSYSGPSLFTIGGAVMLLLFVGIHNSWDSVTYMVIQRKSRKE